MLALPFPGTSALPVCPRKNKGLTSNTTHYVKPINYELAPASEKMDGERMLGCLWDPALAEGSTQRWPNSLWGKGNGSSFQLIFDTSSFSTGEWRGKCWSCRTGAEGCREILHPVSELGCKGGGKPRAGIWGHRTQMSLELTLGRCYRSRTELHHL